MSLLDDVSIVVTPNGYKAGTLYGVLPTATLGSEQVTNGDFATNLDSWGIAGNSDADHTVTWTSQGARYQSTTTSPTLLLFQNTLTSGKTYKFTVDIAYTSGTIKLQTGSGGSLFNPTLVEGTNTFYFTASNTQFLFIRSSANVDVLIDNVSIKEWTSSDMDVTRATAATRVDENGLVNYAEVLKDSILTGNNSTFDTGIGDWVTYNGATLTHSTDKLEVTLVSAESGATITTNTLISGGQAGKLLKISADIWRGTTTDTAFKIYIGNVQEDVTITNTQTNYVVYLTPSTTSGLFIYRAGSGNTGTFYVDNVKVEEVTRNNVPRIDYTGGGCPHILAEPQRTNLITYSEDFSNSYWTKSGASVTSGFTSPSATNNAFKLVENTSNSNHQVYRNTITTTGSFSNTIFVKAAERSKIRLNSGSSSESVSFNLSNGTIISQTGATGKIVSMLNGWYKCTISWNVTSVAAQYLLLGILDDSGNASYTGNGSSGVYIWGAQFEVGSYPTSYIPTSGSAVTRNKDVFTRDGIGSLIGQTEGTIFVDFDYTPHSLNYESIVSLQGTTSAQYLECYFNSLNKINVGIYNGGAVQLSFVSATQTAGNKKIAIAYKANDFAIYLNGTQVHTDNSGSVPLLSKLGLGSDFASSNYQLSQPIKQLQVYKTALTDLQIESITSWTSFSEMANALNYTIY